MAGQTIIANAQTLDRVYSCFKDLFMKYLPTACTPWSNDVALEITSSTARQEYLFPLNAVIMKLWDDERQVSQLNMFSFSITNRRYQAAIEISTDQLMDTLGCSGANLDSFGLHFRQLAYAAAKWKDQRVAAALQSGLTAVSYDGLPFFSAAHLLNPSDPYSATYSNLWTGASSALSHSAFSTVRAARASRVDGAGNPMCLQSDILLVPPQLEGVAKTIVESEYAGVATIATGSTAIGSQTNIWKGTARVVVAPELSNQPTAWYLLDSSSAMKPIIVQTKGAPEMNHLQQGSDHHFKTDNMIFGAVIRGEAGLTSPHFIDRSNGV